jgi:hypothetical protein
MIITHLIGGLGNQLFQYAIAYDLSLRHNTKVILDISGFDSYKLHNYSLQHFNIPQNFYLTQRENFPSNLIDKFNQKRINPKKTIQIQESGYAFDKNYIDFPNNSHLYGYWQSERYFMSISGLLLNKLEIKTPSSPENTILLDKMRGCESIGLHIRRCDYAPNSHKNQILFSPDLNYYYRCIEFICERTRNPHFFIFSDDPKWAQENLIINHMATFISHNDSSKNYEDLRLMSNCQHNIISNSTFSWWAAWLNPNINKMICAPKTWFSGSESLPDTKDLIPENWSKI